jgi:hypothetical protein
VAKGGSITVDAAKPPAITTKLLLDGTQNSSILPWTNSNTSGSKCVRRPFPLNPGAIGVFPFYTPTASIKMGDHPMARVPAILINAKTNVDNHLLSVVDDREFWTIFAVRNPAKKFQFLAHFHAKLRWDIRFKWKAAIPFATMQAASSFKCDPVEMGPPKELQNLLKNPTGPIFNTQLQLAIKAAFPSPGTPNRMDADDQVAVVPKDFFK